MFITESFLHRCPDGTPLGREARLKDPEILKYPVRLAQLIGREVHGDGLQLFRGAGKLLYRNRSLLNEPVAPDGRRWVWASVPPGRLHSRILHTDQPDHLAMSAIYAPANFPGRSTVFSHIDPCITVTKSLIPDFRDSLSRPGLERLDSVLAGVEGVKPFSGPTGRLHFPTLSVWQRLRNSLNGCFNDDYSAAENFVGKLTAELRSCGWLYEHFWEKDDLIVLSSGIFHARGAGSSYLDGEEGLLVDDLD